jgi:hypothetical protein
VKGEGIARERERPEGGEVCNTQQRSRHGLEFLPTVRLKLTANLRAVAFANVSTIGVVRFKVFTEVTTKNAVFWDVMPCGSYKNRHFGGAYRFAAWFGC